MQEASDNEPCFHQSATTVVEVFHMTLLFSGVRNCRSSPPAVRRNSQLPYWFVYLYWFVYRYWFVYLYWFWYPYWFPYR